MLIAANVLDSTKFCHVTISFKNFLYRQNHNSQNRTARKGLPRQDWHRIALQDWHYSRARDRTASTGLARQKRQVGKVIRGQLGKNNQDRTAWSGPPEQDNKNRTIRTSTTNFFFKTKEISIPHKKVIFTSSKFIF